MRIIFLSRYQGKVERGVENYAAELAPRLAKLGNEVEILTSFWQLFKNQKRPGLRLQRPGLTIIYPLNGYWQTLGCRLYAWAVGAKLAVGGHAGIGRDDRWNLYMLPDLFIAFSKKGYEWAKKVSPSLMIRIIRLPHGVNLDKFNLTVRPAKLGLERPIFVTAAHLEPYKRVDLTVKAVAELRKGSLLVLGEGPMEKEVDELGNKLLGNKGNRGDKGRYLRMAVRHERVAGYLRAGDVFTLVSAESEAFGLVYLEAMACGLPVVATDDSLRRELVGDAGVFVKRPEDSREYAGCLERAIREDWGDKPVKQAKKFDWEKIAVRCLEEFKGI